MEVKTRFEDARATAPGRPLPRPMPDGVPATLPATVAASARRWGDRPFLLRRHARGGDPVSFAGLAAEVRRTAAGLAALGVRHGDRVGLISENRCEWLVADLACATLGAVDVPRGVDTAPAELAFILRHSGARVCLVETDEVARDVVEMRDQLPDLSHVCSLQPRSEVPDVLGFEAIAQQGETRLREDPEALDRVAEAVTPEDLLTIVYTSGTTADPKGVMLTHANLLSNVHAAAEALGGFDERDRALSALPPWHVYERMMGYLALTYGIEFVYTDRRNLKDDLRNVRPTVFAAVPRIWEALHDGVVHHAHKLGPVRRTLVETALATSQRVGAGRARVRDRITHRLLDRPVLRGIRAATGGRLRVAVSGGGSLPAHVDQTMLGLGIPLLNGYGLTETSPVVSVRRLDDNRWGTIGRTLPGTEVEIRDDAGRPLPQGATGHIWIRGPGVMQGYHANPERTAKVLVEGWFDSGDLGRIDDAGHLCITGRAKDTIVLAGGENVEPEPVETALCESPYITQAVVLGQDRKALAALVFAATDALERAVPKERWGAVGEILAGPDVHKFYRRAIDKTLSRNNGFRAVERIANFCVLCEPMTPENGLLTPTMKVRRHVVNERYAETISGLFERG